MKKHCKYGKRKGTNRCRKFPKRRKRRGFSGHRGKRRR